MLGLADALALQQDPAGGVQGDRVGRDLGRDYSDLESWQRRELLCGAKKLHGRHEEPGGKVQRSQIRGEVGQR